MQTTRHAHAHARALARNPGAWGQPTTPPARRVRANRRKPQRHALPPVAWAMLALIVVAMFAPAFGGSL